MFLCIESCIAFGYFLNITKPDKQFMKEPYMDMHSATLDTTISQAKFCFPDFFDTWVSTSSFYKLWHFFLLCAMKK